MRIKVLSIKNSDNYLEATIEGEDHTLFAPLLNYLLKQKGVKYAMYDMDHPLTRRVTLKIQTIDRSPMDVLSDAVANMLGDLDSLKEQLMNELGGS
ncbi:MAG: DNA-directed RNA polymerase subunit L [Thermocladium sp.]